MAITKEDIIPSLIPNTTMQRGYVDGVLKRYEITPNNGYVLHDSRVYEEIVDPETLEPTGEILHLYGTGTKTVNANYDFTLIVPDTITDINGNTIVVNKIGAYEFFTVPASAIPENQIWGGNDNEHEVM